MEWLENPEEKLREAASTGDKDLLNKLITNGAQINSQNKMNGWTALHWASKRGHFELVCILLHHRAEPSIKNFNGETAADVAFNEKIKQFIISKTTNICFQNFTEDKYVQTEASHNNELMSVITTNVISSPELVLKIKEVKQTDFIEIELDLSNLTYQNLIDTCAYELKLKSSLDISKVRKLPNTIIRKDKDVKRLNQFQEIEIETN
ncbi:ankyrin repeat domain-containing protein 40 [Hydra vulgaris]|uniref:Ankyrin repeat domain-containing protein 40 n=1 Tax=Hydra vulgaris TaxID=6087 RepID=A0ABM4CZK7_HYDVU